MYIHKIFQASFVNEIHLYNYDLISTVTSSLSPLPQCTVIINQILYFKQFIPCDVVDIHKFQVDHALLLHGVLFDLLKKIRISVVSKSSVHVNKLLSQRDFNKDSFECQKTEFHPVISKLKVTALKYS